MTVSADFADERRARRRRMSQVILALPAVAFLAIALHGIVADYRHVRRVEQRAAARTERATGSVVSLHWHYSLRTYTSWPDGIVAFTTASGRTIRFDMPLDGGEKVGTRVAVNYDPDDPENYAIGNDRFGYSDLAWSNAAPLAFGLYFVWLVAKVRRSS